MPSNLTSQDTRSAGDTLSVITHRRRSRIARLALGLALATGLGVGVASTQFSAQHTTASHTSTLIALESPSTGVTGGPGNG